MGNDISKVAFAENESLKLLLTALHKAQKELPGVKKDSINPHFKNHYASLENVIETVADVLSKNDLILVQTFDLIGGVPCLRTTLYHTSGERITGVQPLLMIKQDAQGLASASTYARRYGILGILGIASEDDDGEVAHGRGPVALGQGDGRQPPTKNEKELIARVELVKKISKGIEEIERLGWKGDAQTLHPDPEANLDQLTQRYLQVVKIYKEVAGTSETR